MKVILDTNILLDICMTREPWLQDSLNVISACDAGSCEACIAAFILPTLFYVVRQYSGKEFALLTVKLALAGFQILPTDLLILESAAALAGPDFEDNVIIATAMQFGVDVLVTRDARGFERSSIAVDSPKQFLNRIGWNY